MSHDHRLSWLSNDHWKYSACMHCRYTCRTRSTYRKGWWPWRKSAARTTETNHPPMRDFLTREARHSTCQIKTPDSSAICRSAYYRLTLRAPVITSSYARLIEFRQFGRSPSGEFLRLSAHFACCGRLYLSQGRLASGSILPKTSNRRACRASNETVSSGCGVLANCFGVMPK